MTDFGAFKEHIQHIHNAFCKIVIVLGPAVYISYILGIVPVEVDILNFRYFDANGNQLTSEQLKTMRIVTPAMEHIFATVMDRIEKSWKQADNLEERSPM